MTGLRKPVYREISSNGSRALVIGIEPPGILTFREKGTRKTYALGLQTLFVRAVIEHVESERATKRKRSIPNRRRRS